LIVQLAFRSCSFLLLLARLSFLKPEPNNIDLYNRLTGPAQFTGLERTALARDVFNRIIYGGQISLFIGVLAVVLEVTLGTVIGGVAAYFGGWVDAILMRFTEAMLAIPSLFLLIVLAKFSAKVRLRLISWDEPSAAVSVSSFW